MELDQIVAEITGPDSEFPLGEIEIDGVPYKHIQNGPPTLREYYGIALLHGDAPFIVYDNETWSFVDGLVHMTRTAHGLITKLGAKKGDRIVIAMRNYPEWAAAFMAVTAIGCVAVPLNGWWTEEEFDYGMEDCGATIALVDDERMTRIAKPAARLGIKMAVARPRGPLIPGAMAWDDLVSGMPADALPDMAPGPDDDATIFYTSGSTGHPKGVVSTHRAILQVMLMWAMVGRARLIQLGKADETPAFPPAVLMAVPLFHVTGSHSQFLLSFLVGRKIVLMYRWDPQTALQLIERERVTGFTGVPTMSWEMLNQPNLDDFDLSSFTDIGSGGAARPADHVRQLKSKFGTESNPTSGYGLTETNAAGAINAGDDYVARPGSTGRPTPPLVEMKIVDAEGHTLPTGGEGEILIKSVGNARGYWNKPDATAEAFRDGWFYTGDIGKFDEDGYLYIVDRAKDIVIRGGENISCLEVEGILFAHPDVLEAAVFGVPDERLGETVGAVLVPKPGRVIDPDNVKAFVREHIAAFKVPEHIWIQQEQLPRTGSGKIFKRQLKDELTKGR